MNIFLSTYSFHNLLSLLTSTLKKNRFGKKVYDDRVPRVFTVNCHVLGSLSAFKSKSQVWIWMISTTQPWIGGVIAVDETATLHIPDTLYFLDSGGRAGAILVLMVLLIIQRIGSATPPPKRPSPRKRKEEREKAEKDGGDIACNCKKKKPRGILPWLIKFFTS